MQAASTSVTATCVSDCQAPRLDSSRELKSGRQKTGSGSSVSVPARGGSHPECKIGQDAVALLFKREWPRVWPTAVWRLACVRVSLSSASLEWARNVHMHFRASASQISVGSASNALYLRQPALDILQSTRARFYVTQQGCNEIKQRCDGLKKWFGL